MVRVKICGLTSEDAIEAAANLGAAYIGLVNFTKSPRHVELPLLRDLSLAVPMGVMKVGLLVNPSDGDIEAMLNAAPLDMLQLHGRETPARAVEIKEKFGLPVMKAIGVREKQDLAAILDYGDAVDQILIDAKAPKEANLPGGNGLSFDWTLTQGMRINKPWMLAGGLTPENIAEAVRVTGARQVDVSSGVESAPGIKDPDKIKRFMDAIGG